MNVHHKHGFTLIELMVVLSLFALISILGVLQLSYLDSTIVHIELEKCANMCSFLQQHAITTNTEKVLICDTKKNAYHSGNIHEILPSSTCFGFRAGVHGPPGNPSHIITNAVTFPNATLHFYPTGSMSSGTIYFTDKKRKIMYAVTNAVSQISWLRRYKYNNGWKLINTFF